MVRSPAGLNLNLREDKGYTYGASSMFAYGRRLGFWAAGAGVQTQFTRETLLEFRKEVRQIREERMITADELEMAKTNLIRGFAQRFETLGRLVDQVVDVVSFDLPLEDIQQYPQSMDARVFGAGTKSRSKIPDSRQCCGSHRGRPETRSNSLFVT